AHTDIRKTPSASIRHEDRRFAIQAVDATVSTSTIRIDRLAEPDVRRLVAADDRPRRLGTNYCADFPRPLLLVPAVVFDGLRELVEAARRIRERSPSFE